MEQNQTRPQNNVQGGKDRLQELLNEVNEIVQPYPPIDVYEKLPRSRETPKGHAIKVASYTSAALLVSIALYGMITHDREILVGLAYSAVLVLAWIFGKKIPGRPVGSRKVDDRGEENN
jgi:hypothetical protein